MISLTPRPSNSIDGFIFYFWGRKIKMLKIFTLGFIGTIACIVFVNSSRADDCPAGKYIDDTGACTDCGSGYYYCPGDTKQYPCPTPSEHKNSVWPEKYLDPQIVSVSIYIDNSSPKYFNNNAITRCSAIYDLKNQYGIIYDIRRYNTDTQLYDVFSDGGQSYKGVNPGYYLKDRYRCGAYAYYSNAAECLAGGYCPGKSPTLCNSNNQDTVYTETFGLTVCPDNTYSDAGAAACTPCPAGTGNNGDTLADHETVSSCKPLCTHGGTKLRTTNYSVNIWPDKQCSVPSIKIGFPDGVCCVNLATGSDHGINININGNIYHTVN